MLAVYDAVRAGRRVPEVAQPGLAAAAVARG
jgi:hypothetical protein